MSDRSNARPADVVSPITDGVLPYQTSLAEARAAGRRGYEKPTPANSVMLLVDHQIGLISGMRDTTSLAELVANVVGLARTARARDADADHHLQRPVAERRHPP